MLYNEYEIIVVNDGSPDNSEALVRKLQNEIPNILLINQENAGVSAARNRGIENASGEYLVFIDPDDYVNPNLLKRLYDRAKKDELEILLCGRSIVKPNGEIFHNVGYGKQENQIFNGVDAFYEKDKPFAVFDTCWGRLYKRELVTKHKINFPEGVVHLEDGVFVRKIFTLAKQVGFENCDFYQVFERPGSASRSKIGLSEKAVNGDIISVRNLLDFKKSYNLTPSQAGIINSSIIKYTLLPLMRAINAKDISSLIKYNKILINEGFNPCALEWVPKNSYLKYAKAYNRSLWLFVAAFIFNPYHIKLKNIWRKGSNGIKKQAV